MCWFTRSKERRRKKQGEEEGEHFIFLGRSRKDIQALCRICFRSATAERDATTAHVLVPRDCPSATSIMRQRRPSQHLRWTPPQGFMVSSHCPRISDFTQCLMLGWTPIRLQVRFDWKKVDDMTGAYMDRTSRISPASLNLFSPDVPGDLMRQSLMESEEDN